MPRPAAALQTPGEPGPLEVGDVLMSAVAQLRAVVGSQPGVSYLDEQPLEFGRVGDRLLHPLEELPPKRLPAVAARPSHPRNN
jgi:hypothetical protein